MSVASQNNTKSKNASPRSRLFKMIALGFAVAGTTQVGAGVVREYAPSGTVISLREEYAAAAACTENLERNQPCSFEQQKALSEVASNEALFKKGGQKLLVAALLM